ncbi:unnamed protein product, partial [Ectocarpus sp. 12 AP-2014]
ARRARRSAKGPYRLLQLFPRHLRSCQGTRLETLGWMRWMPTWPRPTIFRLCWRQSLTTTLKMDPPPWVAFTGRLGAEALSSRATWSLTQKTACS